MAKRGRLSGIPEKLQGQNRRGISAESKCTAQLQFTWK